MVRLKDEKREQLSHELVTMEQSWQINFLTWQDNFHFKPFAALEVFFYSNETLLASAVIIYNPSLVVCKHQKSTTFNVKSLGLW